MWHRLTRNLLVLGLLSITPSAFAEDPAPGSLVLQIDFLKSVGLFDYASTDNGPDGSFQTLKNIDFKREVNAGPRKGNPLIHTFNVPNGSYHGWNFLTLFVSTTNHRYFLNVVNRRPEYIDDDFALTPGQVFGPDPTVLNLNSGFDITNWNGVAYLTGIGLVNGGRKIYETDPNSSTPLSISSVVAMPNGSFMQPHLDRLLISGNTSFPLRVFYSEADQPELWPAVNYFDITGIREADMVVGIGSTLLGSLPLYTKNTTRVVTGTVFPSTGTGGNINVREVSSNIGAVHHRTIKNIRNLQYFYSMGPNQTVPGIYTFNGISIQERTKAIRSFFKTNVINYDIRQSINGQTSTATPNSYVYNDKYCLNFSSPSGLYNFFTVCIDESDIPEIFEGGSAANGTGKVALDMVTVNEGVAYGISGNPAISNTLFQLDKDDADGSGHAIPWNWKTKDYSAMQSADKVSSKLTPKLATRAYIIHATTPTTFILRANYDFGKSSTTWMINSTTSYKNERIETVSKTSASVVNKLLFPRESRFNWINFESSGTTPTFIDSLTLIATPEPLR